VNWECAPGEVEVTAIDSATGQPVVGAWYELQPESGPAHPAIDGINDAPGWANEVDGTPDGIFRFTNVPSGRGSIHFQGVIDPTHAWDAPVGAPISHYYADTVMYHPVQVNVGEVTRITIPLVGPMPTVDVQWVDSCNEPLSDELVSSEGLFIGVSTPFQDSWMSFWDDQGTGYGGQVQRSAGIVNVPIGPGHYTVSVGQITSTYPNILESQVVDTYVGQTTSVTIVVNAYGNCSTAARSAHPPSEATFEATDTPSPTPTEIPTDEPTEAAPTEAVPTEAVPTEAPPTEEPPAVEPDSGTPTE
jgi:hypothetical protein